MELRAEPRFGTRSSALIEVIRDKVYTYDTTITEVSGIGLQMEMAEELTVGETIRLLVNNYHMLAQVRRCMPSESGFIIGVERIDAWNGPPAGSALDSSKTAATSPLRVLGRPKLNHPLDNLHRAALRGLFADPRWRSSRTKYQAVLIAAGCMALAGWAGFGAGLSVPRKPRPAAPATSGVAKQSPDASKSAGNAARPDVAPTKLVGNAAVSSTTAVPARQMSRVEGLTAQKAGVGAAPKATARRAIVPASRISIRASDATRVTACVDGAKVLDTLLVKGYVGQIPFSRQALLRFGNAGAIELAVGNQSAARLGQPGEARTIKVTPTGYELMTIQSAFNCNLH